MTTIITKAPAGSQGYRLTAELHVAQPREQVFEFFSDAFQLETITPPWLHFSVDASAPIEMRAGTRIDYKLRVRGIPLRWRSKISVWEPPFRFVDEQLRGPYRHWHHLHTFEETDDGTIIRDVVDYAVPFGFLLHPLVRRDLREIFAFRQTSLSQIFTVIA